MSESSVNLPKTNFPMRGNLPQKEPETIKFWNENGINTRSAGSADENFYNRLLEILSNYKNIIKIIRSNFFIKKKNSTITFG